MAAPERKEWEALLSEIPSPLTQEEKATFMSELTQVSLASDAFFPFRDSIDVAAKLGVTYVSQPGGSTRDREIMAACEEYTLTFFKRIAWYILCICMSNSTNFVEGGMLAIPLTIVAEIWIVNDKRITHNILQNKQR